LDDIIYDIMNRKKIGRLRKRIQDLRRKGGVRAAELETVAKSAGRRRHKRGREPTWVSRLLPTARPIAITSHPGDLNRHTAKAILDQLEADLDALEEVINWGCRDV
jgi:hypothetical protein